MPSKEELTGNYRKLIYESLNIISERYFTVANRFEEMPVISERIFCYEFYHQLRNSIDKSTNELCVDKICLHGELSKARYKGKNQDGTDIGYGKITPDLLIHNPENSELNLIAIEVKPNLIFRNSQNGGIEKDFIKLCNLVGNIEESLRYKLGLFILFNYSFNKLLDLFQDNWNTVLCENRQLFKENKDSIEIITIKSVGEIEEKKFSDILNSIP